MRCLFGFASLRARGFIDKIIDGHGRCEIFDILSIDQAFSHRHMFPAIVLSSTRQNRHFFLFDKQGMYDNLL
jgi:hypothetical protein